MSTATFQTREPDHIYDFPENTPAAFCGADGPLAGVMPFAVTNRLPGHEDPERAACVACLYGYQNYINVERDAVNARLDLLEPPN